MKHPQRRHRINAQSGVIPRPDREKSPREPSLLAGLQTDVAVAPGEETVFDGFALGLQAGQKIIVSIKDRKIRHLDRLFGCSWNCGIISRRGC